MRRNRSRARTWGVAGLAGALAIATVIVTLTGPSGNRADGRPGRPSPARTGTLPGTPASRDPLGRPTPGPYATATIPAGSRPLTATGGRPFADGSAWNTPIPAHPRLAANSRAAVAHLSEHVVANLYAYGTPVYTVTGPAAGQNVACIEKWGPCLLQDVPIPGNARPAPGDDGAMVVIDTARRAVYDFWRLRRTGTGWQTSWGTANPLYGSGDERGGAVGAGFSGLAGLVRRFEIRRGHIDHALHFSSDASCAGRFAYPATKTDGISRAGNCVAEGARVQLDPSIDVGAIPGITRAEKTVARALQRYGAYNRDNGAAPMAFGFENPAGRMNPYPAAGLPHDYAAFPHIPWHRLRVLASWNGR